MTDENVNGRMQRTVADLVGQVHALRRQLRSVQRATPTRRTVIDSGPGLVVKNEAGDEALRFSPTSTGAVVPEYLTGATPGAPSGPVVVAGSGIASIHADGTDTAGDAAPDDHARTEVHASLTEGFAPGPGTLVARMLTPVDTVAVPRPAGLWHFCLVWVTLSGKRSEPSAHATADVQPPLDEVDLQDALDEVKEAMGALSGTEPPTEPSTEGRVYYQRDAEGEPVAVYRFTDGAWVEVPAEEAIYLRITTDWLVAGRALIGDTLIDSDSLVTGTAFLEALEASDARFRGSVGGRTTTVSGDGLLVTRTHPDSGEDVPETAVGGGYGTAITAYDPDTGEALGGLGSDGSGSFTELSVAGDPVLDGSPLLGSMAELEDDTPYLDRIPRGLVGWHQGSPGDVGPYAAGVEFGFIQVNFEIRADRRYRIMVNAPHIVPGGGNSVTHQLRYVLSGNPDIASSLLKQWGTNIATESWLKADDYFDFNGASYTSSTATMRVLFSVRSGNSWSFVAGGFYRQIGLHVHDIGPRVDPSGQMRFVYDGSGGGGTQPPDPSPNPVITYNSAWNADWFASYMSGGSQRQTQGNGAIMLKQGYDRYWSGGGIQTSQLGFTNGADAGNNIGQLITTALSGATLVRGHLSVAAGYLPAGATKTLRVYWHGNTAAPGSYTSTAGYLGEMRLGAGGRHNFSLPMAALQALQNGSIRGFGFSPGGSTADRYALGVSWSTRPYLNITYRK